MLAHAYLRDDHVLDDVLPPEMPIPPLAEVQVALAEAAAEIVTGESGEALKRRLRTGTVVTTDDRNWELRYSPSALRFNQSRAVAIDMESATIAAQGYRFRTPYGTLLCVSDKPLHGEIKLPGQANAFYETGDRPAPADRHRRHGPAARGGRPPALAQTAQLRRAAVPVRGKTVTLPVSRPGEGDARHPPGVILVTTIKLPSLHFCSNNRRSEDHLRSG